MAEDSEWVVESIAGYLGSPEWLIPVNDFMENKCTVFDDEDENKLSYTEIHQQYKQLVEKLLESYMQEVGINEQQFLEACSSPFAQSKTLQSVFRPVLATDDFQMFRSLMVQKNMELQLQALQVIKETNGALPECLTDGVDVMSELEIQEMKILQEVLRRSKEEYEEEMTRRKRSEEEIGSTSSRCSNRQSGEFIPKSLPIQITNNNNKKDAVTKTEEKGEDLMCAGDKRQKSLAKTGPPAPERSGAESKALPTVRVPVKGTEPLIGSRDQSWSSQSADDWLDEAWMEAGISKPFTELSAAQQEQLQQRALYLRQQRDKLQAMKKEQRPKPVSPEPPQATASIPEISVEEKKKLQKRKHLAEKLKEEVIKK